MIPFSKNNNQLMDYVSNLNEESVNWKDNYEFDDIMIAESISRGRSSATFKFISELDGRIYNVFMKDVLEMIKYGDFTDGKIKGKFTFCKRGTNYGLKLVFNKKG